MFDIGFTELLLIGVVALIVVGPERLPSVIRTTLGYVRQIKSSFANVRDEVERELDLNHLKEDLLDSKEDLQDSIGYDDIHDSIDDLKKTSEELRDIASDGYEYADNFIDSHVHDAEIEADLDHLVRSNQILPNANAEADTGIEEDFAEKAAKKNKKKKQAKKKAKKKAKKQAKKLAKTQENQE